MPADIRSPCRSPCRPDTAGPKDTGRGADSGNYTPLLYLSASGDCKGTLHAVAAHAIDDVMQVADRTGVVGDDCHAFADRGARVASGDVEVAVLLAEPGQCRLRIFQHLAVAFQSHGVGG